MGGGGSRLIVGPCSLSVAWRPPVGPPAVSKKNQTRHIALCVAEQLYGLCYVILQAPGMHCVKCQPPLWGHSSFSPSLRTVGAPKDGRGYVANLPTCGPLLIFSPTLKPWGPPGRKGLCSQSSTCGPLPIFSLALKRWGPP